MSVNVARSRRQRDKGALISTILVVVTAMLLWSGCTTARPDNVVVILVDTLRADHLGCYGYERPTSPNIDNLARRSFVADDAIAQAPWTLPSVASFFTSMYPTTHGAITAGHAVPDCLETLPELLKRNGFETGGISTNVFVSEKTGLSQGFDSFEVLSTLSEERKVAGVKIEIPEPATAVTDHAIEWISHRSRSRFFLYVHYMDPHSDYAAPPSFRSRFERPYSGPFDGRTEQLVAANTGKIPIEDADVRHLIDLYDAEIAYVDAEIGRLLGHLEKSGLSDRTVIVLLADHGEEFYDHGKLSHGFSLHRELVRVPLIVRVPGSSGVRHITEIVQLIDVGPTILDFLHVRDDRSTQGRSFAPQLRDSAADGWDHRSFSEVSEPRLGGLPEQRRLDAIVTPRWWYITGSDGSKALYDATLDLHQENDRASTEEATRARLAAEIGSHVQTMKAVGAPCGAKTSNLGAADRERLRALGYIQ